MKFTKDDKKYLKKLKKMYPKNTIPKKSIVKKAVSKMKKDGNEIVIDDLIIRNYEGMVELELI
jgi:hypothetical protein